MFKDNPIPNAQHYPYVRLYLIPYVPIDKFTNISYLCPITTRDLDLEDIILSGTEVRLYLYYIYNLPKEEKS